MSSGFGRSRAGNGSVSPFFRFLELALDFPMELELGS
jgi:hypothetical protein